MGFIPFQCAISGYFPTLREAKAACVDAARNFPPTDIMEVAAGVREDVRILDLFGFITMTLRCLSRFSCYCPIVKRYSRSFLNHRTKPLVGVPTTTLPGFILTSVLAPLGIPEIGGGFEQHWAEAIESAHVSR